MCRVDIVACVGFLAVYRLVSTVVGVCVLNLLLCCAARDGLFPGVLTWVGRRFEVGLLIS